MGRAILGIVLGGGLGALAGNAALLQFFGVNFDELLGRLTERGPVFAAVVALPILFLLVRGWVGHIIAMALVAGGVALTLKFGLDTQTPWTQVATLAGAYSVVAVVVYRLLVSRWLG